MAQMPFLANVRIPTSAIRPAYFSREDSAFTQGTHEVQTALNVKK